MIITLQIKKIDTIKWKTKDGYYMAKGFSFYSPEMDGFMVFKNSNCLEIPYRPKGGKKALQSIKNDGGLVNYNNVLWIKPLSK